MKHIMLAVGALLSLSDPVLAQPPAPPVVIYTTKNADFVNEIEALGTLRARESINLSSLVTERVDEIAFDDGERVKKGQLLLVMDQEEERAQRIEAKTLVDEAQRQLNRLSSLVEKDAGTESLLDQRRSELESAKARLSIIETRIAERRIRAPFDGVLGLRNISVGSLIRVGDVITTLDDDSVMKLEFSVPAIYLNDIRETSIIKAHSKIYPEKSFNGVVSSVDSRIDPNTRAVKVRALIDNTEHNLKTGMLMTVAISAKARTNIEIPEQAVFNIGNKSFVYLSGAQSGPSKIEKRAVEKGLRRNGGVEILSGLDQGEFVISHGLTRIKDGAQVNVVAEQTSFDQTLTTLLP